MGDLCQDTPEYALGSTHVKGRTQHQTSPDASLRIIGSGSLRLPYTRHFPMVRHKAVGDSPYIHNVFVQVLRTITLPCDALFDSICTAYLSRT